MHAILIIASAHAADPLAEAIRLSLDLPVHIAPHRRAALDALRRHDFALILLDESLAGADPEGADILHKHAAGATVLELPFAVWSVPRALRQVRSTLARRAHDRASARIAAATTLKNELNATLTGLLLESQLALRHATPMLQPKLRHLVELADDLRLRLQA